MGDLEPAQRNPREMHHDRYSAPLLRFLRNIDLTPADLGIDEVLFEKISTREGFHTRYGSTSKIVFAPDVGRYSGRNRYISKAESFEHTFVEENVAGRRAQVAHLILPESLKVRTLSVIGEEKWNTLEQKLKKLLSMVNHDFTMHHVGVIGNTNTTAIAEETIDFAYTENTHPTEETLSVTSIEQMAVIFHRILFQRIFEKAPRFKSETLDDVRDFLSIISQLPDATREAWYSPLRYLFYSLFDPESEEARDIRKLHPPAHGFRGMEPDTWARVAHQSSLRLKSEFVKKQLLSEGRSGIFPRLAARNTAPYTIVVEKLFDLIYLHAENVTDPAVREALMHSIFKAAVLQPRTRR